MGQIAEIYKIDTVSDEQVFLATTKDSNVSIGRSLSADIKLNDWRCSGIHALIKEDKSGKLNIIDLGSYYGTYVNRKKIDKTHIINGDIITIGDQKMLVKIIQTITERSELIDLLTSKKVIINEVEQNVQRPKKRKSVLETSLFWGEKLIEVKSLKDGGKITIGNPKKATFGMQIAKLKSEVDIYKIGYVKKGKLHLKIPNEAEGLVWIKDKTYALDTLRLYDKEHEGSETISLVLNENDQAHIEFGELSLFFRFVVQAEKIPTKVMFTIDRTLAKIFVGIILFYLALFLMLILGNAEEREKTLDDIPEHLKKVVYDIGIKNADRKRQAAIGNIAQSLQGGRARAAEGASKSKKTKTVTKKKIKKKTKKRAKKKARVKSRVKRVAHIKKRRAKAKLATIDFNSNVALKSDDELLNRASTLSKVAEAGNSASALTNGSFARGRVGLGAGGGGKSVGVGALDGNQTGGGLGSGDYGLAPSKGREIEIKDEEEIVLKNGLDMGLIESIIKGYLPQIQYCYEKGLATKPKLKGKIKVSFVINKLGIVNKPTIVESSLGYLPTEECIVRKIKKWKFPKPKGGSTVGVTYPFILMSNNSN